VRRCVTTAIAVLLLASVGRAQQSPAFSSKVEAVRVDVLVTDNGQPVRGLGPGDFEIVDNGVPQVVDLVSFDEVPLNVILALDMTGDVASVQAALAAAQSSGQTALIDGTYAGIMVGESDAGRALLIVFSDGVDTSSWLRADAVLDTARRADVVVYGVSVVSRLKPEFLREITSLTGGRLFEIEKSTNLASTFLGILEEFRHRYLVSYTPKGVAKDGWHKLDVRVKNRRATIKARPGYLAGDTTRQ
jgi:hypothetical protein